MLFRELIINIESHEFSAKMNYASSFNFFLRLLDEDPLIDSLTRLMIKNPDTIIQTISRVEQLSRLRVNPQYENVNDVAISAYCWALNKVNPNGAKIASAFATYSNVSWWAKKTAVYILENVSLLNRETNSVLSNFNDLRNLYYHYVPDRNPEDITITFIQQIYKYLLIRIFMNKAIASGRLDINYSGWLTERTQLDAEIIPFQVTVNNSSYDLHWT